MSSIHGCAEKMEQIKRMLRGRVADLRVVMQEGRIVLLGTSINYHGKQLAQHLVLNAFGKTNLINEIEVRRSSAPQ
jgi:hypothetical protein